MEIIAKKGKKGKMEKKEKMEKMGIPEDPWEHLGTSVVDELDLIRRLMYYPYYRYCIPWIGRVSNGVKVGRLSWTNPNPTPSGPPDSDC